MNHEPEITRTPDGAASAGRHPLLAAVTKMILMNLLMHHLRTFQS
jgi:hypothetical protein